MLDIKNIQNLAYSMVNYVSDCLGFVVESRYGWHYDGTHLG